MNEEKKITPDDVVAVSNNGDVIPLRKTRDFTPLIGVIAIITLLSGLYWALESTRVLREPPVMVEQPAKLVPVGSAQVDFAKVLAEDIKTAYISQKAEYGIPSSLRARVKVWRLDSDIMAWAAAQMERNPGSGYYEIHDAAMDFIDSCEEGR